MHKKINELNIDEMNNKKPLAIFYSTPGASGPSGSIVIMLDDKSIYYTNILDIEEPTKNQLFDTMPELMHLVSGGGKNRYNLKGYYLGLGNTALLNSNIYDEMQNEENKTKSKFVRFVNLIERYTGFNING